MVLHSHPVHIYRDGGDMERGVGEWLVAALRAGSGAIAICTVAHAQAVRGQLRALGVDVERAEAERHLVILDADASLATFMRDGMPNGALFKRLIRGAIADLQHRTGGRTIRAWGEMVDLLAKNAQPDAALALERLWNEILDESDAELLCSYRLDALEPALYARVLADVCTTHSEVICADAKSMDAAVESALSDVFGADDAGILHRLLPPRHRLLDRMTRGVAVIVALRDIDPALGERVATRARERLQVPAAP